MDFEFPSNIKQIGNIGDGRRIYVEDYAFSFMQQYTESGGYDELTAFLIGRNMIIDSTPVLFISGAVLGKHCQVENGIKVFTDKSFEYLNEQMEKYFKGLEVVGFMQSQPGYGLFLNSSYANYYMETFSLPTQVMFLIDPIERTNTFYVWNEKCDDIKEESGYFIYYDKNRAMHEYMLQNKIKSKQNPPIELIQKRTEIPKDTQERYEEQKPKEEERYKPKGVISLNREERRALGVAPKPDHKRVVNLLASLSAVLLIICFIMGAGYVQNEDRLNKLEGRFSQLSLAYQSLLETMKSDKTAEVFAATTESLETKASNEATSTVENNQSANKTTETQSTTGVIVENGNDLLMGNMYGVELVPVKPIEEVQATSEPSQIQAQATPAPSTQNQTVKRNIPDTYTVQQGDSLTQISIKFYGNTNMVNEIMALNGMDDADKIFFGKVLKLP